MSYTITAIAQTIIEKRIQDHSDSGHGMNGHETSIERALGP